MNDLNQRTPLNLADLKASYHKLALYLSDLDESEQKAIHQDWRYRMIQLSEKLLTTPLRLDWFFHQLMQEHDLIGLISLVHEFNNLQLSEIQDRELSLDFFQMEVRHTGLYLAKTTYTHSHSHSDVAQLNHQRADTLPSTSLAP